MQAAHFGKWKAVRNGADKPIEIYDLATDSAGAGDVTVLARNGNLITERSATIDIRANDVVATSAMLNLRGVGSDGWNYSAGQLIDMNAFNATVSGLEVNGVTMAAGDYTNASGTWIAGTGTLTVVPEPSSAALLGLGGLALILRRRK